MNCSSDYTRQFVELDFSPYEHLGKTMLENSPGENDVPMVEVSGLDKNIIKKLHHKAIENDSNFERKFSVARHDSWQKIAHSDKSTQFIIQHHENWNLAGFVGEITKTPPDIIGPTDDIIALVNLLFSELELTISNARFAKLDPGGWLNPHIDLFDKDPGISYFWMPLHSHIPTVKVFPWGWNENKVGSMYLFNYSKYVHSAVNFGDTTRYILQGRFDLSQCGEKLSNLYQLNKNNFRQLFNQHPISLAPYLNK